MFAWILFGIFFSINLKIIKVRLKMFWSGFPNLRLTSFAKISLKVRNFRKIHSKFSQNSRYSFETFGKFARIQSSWCEIERFRFWPNENWTKISRKWKISFVHFREFRSTKISMETLVLICFQKNQSNLIYFFWEISFLSKLPIY